MGFQSTVSRQIGFGVIGERLFDGPHSALALQINSPGTTNPNRVGRAFTRVAGSDTQVVVGGTPGPGTALAGILVDPKMFASYGVSGNTLGATLDLAMGSWGAFLNFCSVPFNIYFSGPGNIGDLVDMDVVTGELWPRASTSPLPAGRANIAGASVEQFSITAAGLCCARLVR